MKIRDIKEGAASVDQRKTRRCWSAGQDELPSRLKTSRGIPSDGNVEREQ